MFLDFLNFITINQFNIKSISNFIPFIGGYIRAYSSNNVNYLVNTVECFMNYLGLPRNATYIFCYSELYAQKLRLVNHIPGTYGIYCCVNNMIYIGSAFNLSQRLGRHLDNSSGRRSGGALRDDFLKYGPQNFQYIVFDLVAPVSDTKTKLELDRELNALERKLLHALAPKGVLYNSNTSPTTRARLTDVGVNQPIVTNDEMVAIESRLAELKVEQRALLAHYNTIKLQLNPELTPAKSNIITKEPDVNNDIRAIHKNVSVKHVGVPVALIHVLTKEIFFPRKGKKIYKERHTFACRPSTSSRGV